MLHEKLAETLEKAAADSSVPLHQFIVGPPQSGRTTQAMEYAAALRDRGLAKASHGGGDAVFISFPDLSTEDEVARAFVMAAGGVLVVDGLKGVGSGATAGQQAFRARAAEAMDLKQLTIVFISNPRDLADALREMKELGQRLRTTVNLQKTFTTAEIEAYRADKQASALRRARIAEWKQAKDSDLRPKNRISAPPTARFGKPAGGG